MLIRISGGVDGIKQYLEDGHKVGREFTRDELDERVILDGDLQFTDRVIQAISAGRERYLHITLAFKEDQLSTDVLLEITREFRAFSMAASRADEYNFYAEAHLPKIKGYVHQKTGVLIQRKPHIHIVIPRVNLLTGKDLNPFELVERQIKWLSAFQDHVNQKYGLASPKDNRRYTFTGESEMISRYKGDLFKGSNHSFRETLLADVLDRDIQRYEDFEALLTEYGAVRVRNAGRPHEYLSVKPEGSPRGVNLKDAVFSRQFIEKPIAEKQRLLTAEVEQKYETAGRSRPTETELLDTLKEWQEVRSQELKYLHTGSKLYKQSYLPSDDATRRTILDRLAVDFYHKNGDHNHDKLVPKPLVAAVGRNPPPFARGRLRSLSELPVVRHDSKDKSRSEVLLPGNVSSDVEHHRADEHHALRWPTNRPGGARRAGARDRPRGGNDSVVGQLMADVEEGIDLLQVANLVEFKVIRLNLDARRLLDYLSKTHGVVPEKYTITKAKDGSDRVQCGTLNLNVSDFLTREAHLSFSEAAPILRRCYDAQRAQIEHRPRSDQPALWGEFKLWRAGRAECKEAEWKHQRENETKRRTNLKKQFYTEMGCIQGDLSLTLAARKTARSLSRMQRIEAEKELRLAIAAEREALRVRYQGKDAEIYLDFLASTAEGQGENAERALAELRRSVPERIVKKASKVLDIQPGDLATVGVLNSIRRDLTYCVARNGDVTYQINGQDAIVDEAKQVRLLWVDAEVIETSLRLAIAKFGNSITLTGTDEFKRRVVAFAIENGIRLTFKNPELHQYKVQLEKERAGAKAARKSVAPDT